MKTILFQGDSITDCGRNRSNDAELGTGYPLLTEAFLGFDSPGKYRFINRGISGDKIDDVCARLQNDILDVKPDYMSLLIGVNDVWHRIEHCEPIEPAKFEASYASLLETVKASLPQTRLMLLEPFVLHGPATDDRPDQPDRFAVFSSNVYELAARVKKLAAQFDLTFVALQNMLDKAAEKAEPTYWLADGVHPTAKGHELIKREWLKAFQNLA